jgi:small conductance mechanosensitive channel
MPAFLDKHIEKFIDTVAHYTPIVIMALIVLIIGLWVIKRIAILADKAMKRRDMEISLRTFLRSLMSIGLKIVLIVTVAGMIGIGTASFVTVLGAAGLAVGLALQGSLSNFAGGVLILIFKPFKVGDTIEAQGQTGEVKEIQIFNTIMLTGDHKTVILPNGVLSNNTIVNNTRAGNLRIDVQLQVSTENDVEKVKNIIRTVVENNEKVMKKPEPGIFVGKIQDGAINISVKPFCVPDDTSQLASDLYNEIKVAFEKNKIRQPIPTRQVHSISNTDF